MQPVLGGQNATETNRRQHDELSGEEAQGKPYENFAPRPKEWDNPPNIISEQEVANLKAQAKRLFGNKNVWVEMHRGIAWDKEVIENSNAPPITKVVEGVETTIAPTIAEEKAQRRFGGNAATKKIQRNLLKQQCENFTASSSEVLDQTFDRLQKLISQLEIHGESIS
ncbi:hypothetical protein Tco_0090114 [Tanacetum coccineum]